VGGVDELEQAEAAAALAKRMAARVSGRVEGMGRAGTSTGTAELQNGQEADPTLT
jgi:hypothetical protein